ncbi:LacI family DNA-binding transcriptional regulator [Salinactinospora qingdaonensis]|uniref:LacI family DNA-binding transcriptional regulator n=1 Tax=Salinactinospora qingdaonensis TaxID=702744 RepID=A0ABP7GDB6_9ACTN
MTTIHDVARVAGVSISTASYALNGKGSVAPATRRRIQRAAEKLDYKTNARARAFASGRTSILAVTEPLRADTFTSNHMAFVLAAAKAARRYDYDILLLTQEEAAGGLRRVTSGGTVDGIVILDVLTHDERVELARTLKVPSVVVGVPADTAGLVCVDLDFVAAGRMAVQRLAQAGHRRIGFIGHPAASYRPEASNFPPRLRTGLTEEAGRLGVAVDTVTPEVDYRTARRTVTELLSVREPPTALVLHAHEEAHTAALEALADLGRTVPDDVSLISVAQTFDTARFSPAIDAVPLVAERSCERATELLLAMIDGDVEPRLELLSPFYVDHGSVRRPPGTAGPPATPT